MRLFGCVSLIFLLSFSACNEGVWVAHVVACLIFLWLLDKTKGKNSQRRGKRTLAGMVTSCLLGGV